MNQIQTIVNLAYQQIGYTESPPNSNQTKYGKDYGWNGAPWCCMFIWWLFKTSKLENLFYGGNKTASCTALKNYYELHNQYYIDNNYDIGDIAILSFSKNKDIQHCGLIVEKINNTTYKTIEGNTSSDNSGEQSNGGCVALKTRNINNILGVCRPAYSEDIEDEDDNMTDEKFAEMMNRYLRNLSQQEAPEWAKQELQEAVKYGITDGTRPMQLVPRYQAAIMAYRAAKKKK